MAASAVSGFTHKSIFNGHIQLLNRHRFIRAVFLFRQRRKMRNSICVSHYRRVLKFSKNVFPVVVLLIGPAVSQEQQLRTAVILTRHGVRSPLSFSTHDSQEPWPDLKQWGGQCAGDLTPRGQQLMRQMGIFYRAYYADKLLPPKGQCAAGKVYIWADNIERTIKTAEALADGLSDGANNCTIHVHSRPYNLRDRACTLVADDAPKYADYFFHPLANSEIRGCVSGKDVEAVAAGINREVRRLRTDYHSSLQMMQDSLKCCQPKACDVKQGCTLFDLPDRATSSDDLALKPLSWEGIFSTSSTAAENFLLEYANGMECKLCGWGRVRYKAPDCDAGQSFRQMQELHTLYFEKMNRQQYMAKIQGSNLANQILKALASSRSGWLVIFSGHDTDIASVAGLFGLHWKLDGLPEDDTPPGGALIFELWGGDRPESQTVRIFYVHQTLEQLRKPEQFSSPAPNIVPVPLNSCATQPCKFTDFVDVVKNSIDMQFTTRGPGGEPTETCKKP
jgi:4-phytase / acid phosphatase